MNDKELVNVVANIWISNGGDSEGFEWCYKDIKDRIMELEG